MIWIFLLSALAAGMLMPVQAGINVELKSLVGHPILAATLQFLVGTGVLMAVLIAMRVPLPELARLSSAPWWVWMGGICGANYIVVAILLAPRLGAATLIAVSVTGQMLVSLLLDHFGFVGYPIHPLNALRVAGAVLLLAGVVLIQRF